MGNSDYNRTYRTYNPIYNWIRGPPCKEYRAKRHRDAGNLGPSAVKAFGPFRGGQLRIFPKDGLGSGLGADFKIFQIEFGFQVFWWLKIVQ